MYDPELFRDRERPVQIVIGGVIPAIIGAIAGVLIGVSTGAYWAVAIIAGLGGVLAGFEHQDGWGGADRGVVGGAIYAASLLITHAIVGTHAKVSLGSFPPLLIVVVGIISMFLGALGGWLARKGRERSAAAAPAEAAAPADAPAD